jgi:hypothetical protein
MTRHNISMFIRGHLKIASSTRGSILHDSFCHLRLRKVSIRKKKVSENVRLPTPRKREQNLKIPTMRGSRNAVER